MSHRVEAVASGPVNRSWRVVDFAVIWLAGLLGAGIVGYGYGILQPDVSESNLIIAGLAGRYLATLIVFGWLARVREIGEIGLTVQPKDTLYAGVGMLSQIVVALLIYPLVVRLFPDGGPVQDIGGVITSPDTTTTLKMTLFVTAVLIAPFVEELLFRGILLKALQRHGRNLAVVVSSLLFTAIHVPGLSMDNMLASAVVVLPPLFVLGVVLAFLTLRTGRLGPAIFLHSGWNLLVASVLLIPRELLERLEQMG